MGTIFGILREKNLETLAHIINLLYIYGTNKKGGVKWMDKKRRRALVRLILSMLDLLENKRNTALVQKIRGLLYELME